MEFLTDYNLLAGLVSLTALEIVLGIDNVVFIALVVEHLPKSQRSKARTIGLILALFFRIIMLFGLSFLLGLKEPLLSIFSFSFSGKDLLMLLGGLFLIYKATDSIHNEVTNHKEQETKEYKGGMMSTIMQIIVIDIIFSFDSIITAIGIVSNVYVIIIAMSIAMFIMLISSGYIADFIAKHPTIKMLALSFIMMIGVFLIAEGLGFHVPKGYIYFAMSFSLGVETLNSLAKRKNLRE